MGSPLGGGLLQRVGDPEIGSFLLLTLSLVAISILLTLILVFLRFHRREKSSPSVEKADEEENEDNFLKKFGKYGTCSPLLLSPQRTPTRHLRSTSTPTTDPNFLKSSPQHHLRRNSNPLESSSFQVPPGSTKKKRPNTLLVQSINSSVTQDCHLVCPIQPPSNLTHLRSYSASPPGRGKVVIGGSPARGRGNAKRSKMELEDIQREKE